MRPHIVSWLEAVVPGGVASAVAPTWFTCVGLAGVVTLFVMLAIARRHHIDTGIIASIVLWCYVAAVAAGIVVPMAIDAAEQLFITGRVHLRWAGMTSFWGYLAGVAAVAAVCRVHRLPLARLGDLAAAPLGVALMFARLGCFVAGCDFGKVTKVPWALRFPAGSPAWQAHVSAGLVPTDRAESLPVHPTQLYEAALGALITLVALWAARRRWTRAGQGRVFLVAAGVYALGRILIENFRGDTSRGIYLGLASGQIFSLLVLAAVAAGLVLRRARLATALATTTLVLALVDPRHASAQPAQPAQPIQPAPPMYPTQPIQPTPYDAPAGSANPTTGSSSSTVHIGALLGLATPINRRPDQVATLGGFSISIGLALPHASVWLDLDSFGNTDASHGTALLSGSMMTAVSNKLQIGGRIGIGATLVNFKDPAFRDVAGTTVRVDALVEYNVSSSWAVWLRPLSFDVLSAADLGGPITTWQTRIGLGYRFPVGHRATAAPAPAPTPGPGPYPQPAPGPYQQPAPGPYQQPAQGPYPQPSPQPSPTPAPAPRSR